VSLAELDELCRRRGWRLVLEAIDPTGHIVREEGVAQSFLRVRVLDRDREILAGRCQSEPGLEQPHALAEAVLDILRRHGLVA